MHTVSRHPSGTQAMCMEAGPGSESGAKAYWGKLQSWESRTALSYISRTRTTPAHQRPGAWARLPAAHASETLGATREPVSEGNRSARGQSDSRSGLIVAFESRVTNRREPASSEGEPPGRRSDPGRGRWGVSAPYASLIAHGITPPKANSSLRRTGCVNCARPGLWGSRRATAGTTRQKRRHGPTTADRMSW